MREAVDAENEGIANHTQVQWPANTRTIVGMRHNREIATGLVFFVRTGSRLAQSMIKRGIKPVGVWYRVDISNNSSFRLTHPGVLDGSDGSDGTSYPLTENYTYPVAQAMCRVAFLPPLHSA
jgi:hypothetical protein